MYRFLLNFFRGSGFLFFGFLQIIGLFLLLTFNQDQRVIGLSTWKNLTDLLADGSAFVGSFSDAKVQLDSLRAENAELRAQISNAKYQDRYRWLDTLSDIGNLQRYEFLPARVVKNSVNRTSNTITIDKGSRHGLRENMGVVGSNGIVGIVRHVTPFYSDVMSVLHQQSSVSAALRSSGAFGSLVWRGRDARRMQLTDIPLHVRVAVGDTVQTSGYSSMFPEAIFIGKITEVNRLPGSNFYDLGVEPAQDLTTTRYVYVVREVLTQNTTADGE